MHIFLANFKYSKASLAKIEVAKETPKTYKVDSYENLLGHQFIGRVLYKSDVHIFKDGHKALAYLTEQARLHVKRSKESLREAEEEFDKMMKLSAGHDELEGL